MDQRRRDGVQRHDVAVLGSAYPGRMDVGNRTGRMGTAAQPARRTHPLVVHMETRQAHVHRTSPKCSGLAYHAELNGQPTSGLRPTK